MNVADLVGHWSLIMWSIEYPDGRTTLPFGRDPRGLLLYSADGWMSAVLMRAERTSFATPDMRSVPREERARAFDEYLSYAGRWRLQGEATVLHEVQVSLNPLLIGTTQIRQASVERDLLTLAAAESLVPSGHVRHHVTRWRRAV